MKNTILLSSISTLNTIISTNSWGKILSLLNPNLCFSVNKEFRHLVRVLMTFLNKFINIRVANLVIHNLYLYLIS